jgi:hypothetical protein
MNNEIILYQSDELSAHIEVRIADDTVWLNQAQMATLFNQTKQNISLHINNCFKEGELDKSSTVKESLTVQKESSRSVQLNLNKYNSQYPAIQVVEFADAHDRFLILDKVELYHLGASLKDLGKKWFAFSKMERITETILTNLLKTKNETMKVK